MHETKKGDKKMNNGRPVVLITGASSGMGKETAKTLLAEGYTVYTAARRVEKMEDLKALGGIPIKMDVTKEEDMVAAFEQIKKSHGGVDILINNAGFGQYGPMEDTPLEKARYQFDVNMFGMARLTQLVLPYMREKKAGKIINVSSMGGKIYTPLGSWYHATKHAVEGWSDCLRIELKPFGIDVIIIEPGIIDTGFYDVVSGTIPAESQNGPYKEMVQALAGASNGESRMSSSPPSVIANTISRAIRASRPRTRYVAGALARPLILMRRWLGDRNYDRVLSMMMS
jgi:NAD(P)-dependent dehydrogenase (short-subunit alcohol dehydrogenase family)